MSQRSKRGTRGAHRRTCPSSLAAPAASARTLTHDFHGFTYVALLVAITIIGITLGSAGKYWQLVSARDREEELLFRGEQYRLAIERYHSRPPFQFPPSVEELLKDSRTPDGKRYLRRQFKDPVSGEDFVEVRDQLSRRIVAVHSPSDKEPLKQGNFPEEYREFEGKKKYSEWMFVFRQDKQRQVQTGPTGTVR